LRRLKVRQQARAQSDFEPAAIPDASPPKRQDSFAMPARSSEGDFKSRLKRERLDEILATARSLLVERGYDSFTLDELAVRARCSKATLYRRWSNKSDLIVEVIGSQIVDAEPDTGSLRGDLEELVSRIAAGMEQGVVGEIFLAVALAMRRDGELRQAWQKLGLLPGKQRIERIVERAIARGEISVRPDLSLLNSLLPGTFFWAWYVERPEDRNEFCQNILRDVLMPFMLGDGR
jgi:AcrR family transcriptional regulator